MADFSQQIANFVNLGAYEYKFDEIGNEILNPSSSVFQEVYFAFPLADLNYDQNKINAFYDITFTEFVQPITASSSTSSSIQDVQSQLATVTSQNAALQSQLNELVALSEQSSTAATQELVKDTIINLRIQMAQGKTASDFSTDFPYVPLSDIPGVG